MRHFAALLLTLVLAACSLPAVQRPAPPAPQVAAPTSWPAPSTPPSPAAPTPTATAAPTSTPLRTPRPSATPATVLPTPTLAPLSRAERERLFDQVWNVVRSRYLYDGFNGIDWQAVRDELAPRALAAPSEDEFYNLLVDMVRRLDDRHSRYLTPQDVAAEEARVVDGLSYVGIGALVRETDEGIVITQLAPGGPAEEAGLQPRDVIIAIDGIPYSDREAFGPAGPIGRVRGVEGTTVRLFIRSSGGQEREVQIVRRAIGGDAFPPVEATRLPDSRIGVLTINTFSRVEVDQLIRQRLEALLAEGDLDGLIIDVRANGGGFVNEMLATIGLFVDGGSIGTSVGRNDSSALEVPSGRVLPQLRGLPVAVLISGETESAAEMFAAGMQILAQAALVGEPTAGNTENLLPHNFDDGSRLWLAERAYRLPDGTLIEGRGVLPGRPITADWWRYTLAEDPYILAALSELTTAVVRG